MKALYINKTKIVDDFKRLSDIWDTSTNITLRIDIKPQDFDLVVRSLISYLPNDLAYSILSEIAAYENLNEELMQLIFDKGDKGCKVAICLIRTCLISCRNIVSDRMIVILKNIFNRENDKCIGHRI